MQASWPHPEPMDDSLLFSQAEKLLSGHQQMVSTMVCEERRAMGREKMEGDNESCSEMGNKMENMFKENLVRCLQ